MSMQQPIPRTVADLINASAQRMAAANLAFGHGTDNAADEAAWIVTSVLAIDFPQLAARYRESPTNEQCARIEALVDERIRTRKPTAYLLHEAWFAGLKFYVDERTIVPRSHLGEFIVSRFAPWLDCAVTRALDLCTGSGCIAVALAQNFPAAHIDAADISQGALAVAQRNITDYRLDDRVTLIESDLFSAVEQRYDVIVTNPPYVDTATLSTLDAEFRHEPGLAFASGRDGLAHIVRILAEAPAHLKEHGRLFAEVGNSCVTLQARFPDVPFLWLTTSSGDESVFSLSAVELQRYRQRFLAVLAQRGER